MLDILRSLRSLLKISHVHTDGNIFRLHYSLTVIILLAFCIIVTTKQYVGEPIDCLRTEAVDKSIMNSYCWLHTTYSIPRAFNKKVGVDVSGQFCVCVCVCAAASVQEVATNSDPINRFPIQVLTTPTTQPSFIITGTTSGFGSFSLYRRLLSTCQGIFGKLLNLDYLLPVSFIFKKKVAANTTPSYTGNCGNLAKSRQLLCTSTLALDMNQI